EQTLREPLVVGGLGLERTVAALELIAKIANVHILDLLRVDDGVPDTEVLPLHRAADVGDGHAERKGRDRLHGSADVDAPAGAAGGEHVRNDELRGLVVVDLGDPGPGQRVASQVMTGDADAQWPDGLGVRYGDVDKGASPESGVADLVVEAVVLEAVEEQIHDITAERPGDGSVDHRADRETADLQRSHGSPRREVHLHTRRRDRIEDALT